MFLRLIWRTKGPQPDDIPGISKASMRAAWLVKIFLYAGVFIICISGYLITTAEGEGANFFDIFTIPASIQLSGAQVDLAGEIHEYAAWTLIFIAVGHASAALFHHFFKRDRTLVRMLKSAGKSR
jgi:cytochrome b561